MATTFTYAMSLLHAVFRINRIDRFLVPKGVRNPLDELAAAKDSYMKMIINKVKTVKKQEVADLPQLEQPILQDVGEEN